MGRLGLFPTASFSVYSLLWRVGGGLQAIRLTSLLSHFPACISWLVSWPWLFSNSLYMHCINQHQVQTLHPSISGCISIGCTRCHVHSVGLWASKIWTWSQHFKELWIRAYPFPDRDKLLTLIVVLAQTSVHTWPPAWKLSASVSLITPWSRETFCWANLCDHVVHLTPSLQKDSES